mmetsp:Transcript_6270/g.15600  ORF Transcript_6270/g.15600 Transcript_6270/m.15600 type:complete len:492 (-) Transcript_6270:169-1644(-)|eukprot:CAMPEP_0181106522 /NCGR_PEP_ID=MMETSP1071-20121207/16576_1 /TAXON_ID=35127 /ORGANISM="Thalassiosira sp., Strain NH16" /LENGTH=491 /DNA_ID=CAMNT_0023189933 /DNA_START=100 /DNA_END=1575 /DNA_ORIENTATION=-
MTDYNLIFGAVLLFNVLVTFRASSYWKKYFPSDKPANDGDGQEEDPSPLIKEGDSSDLEQGDKSSSAASDAAADIRHSQLLRKYLIVYLLAAASDWLQGPYVYALYDAYGYSQHEIAVLFVAGFGSSMVFGSFVGGMADQGGRRRFVIIFAIIYALSCMTKHFKNFHILMIGRLLGGVATSLLFSVFEAWLVGAHSNAGVMSHLGKSFSSAQFGNSIVAILAGQVANRAANHAEFKPTSEGSEFYLGGYLGPFDISLLTLVICGLLAGSLWDENYGEKSNDDSEEKSGESSATGALKGAFTTTIRSPDILSCGIISSLFEGSMYIFVFMWTPALTTLVKEEMGDKFDGLPFGIIFSTFMVSCMAGSSIFSIAMEKMKPEQLAVFVFGVASSAFFMIVSSGSATQAFLAMNLFEMCVGMYFPSMGTMKGMIVPENKRAAIYNLFRIPLNFIVLSSLLTDLTPRVSYILCGMMLAVATVLQMKLKSRRVSSSS